MYQDYFIDCFYCTFNLVASPLTFSAVYEADQSKTVMAGSPIALQCELPAHNGQVSWHKDEAELLPENEVAIQSQENLRSLVVPSAEQTPMDVCNCESDDDIQFSVDVKGDVQKLFGAFPVLESTNSK